MSTIPIDSSFHDEGRGPSDTDALHRTSSRDRYVVLDDGDAAINVPSALAVADTPFVDGPFMANVEDGGTYMYAVDPPPQPPQEMTHLRQKEKGVWVEGQQLEEDDGGLDGGEKDQAGVADGDGDLPPPPPPQPSRKQKIQRMLIRFIVSLAMTLVVSVVSYLIALKLGTFSIGSIGEQLQDQIASVVKIELDRRVDPLVIFLQQVVDFIAENEIDVEDNSQLRAIMPVAHSFLRNYFDDSRCCFGAFVNVQMPGDSGPFAPDSNVLQCHAIEAPNCAVPTTLDNPKAQWVGVLHWSDTYANETGFYSQVLPTIPAGSAQNNLYFKSYEGASVMKPGNSEKHAGFVPLPYGDGYWFWLNVKYNLTLKETRFAPVFPFDLYPPIVLKTHVTTPLYSPDGRRVGAMVTGFKLHWVSTFLASLRTKEGLFIMLVERATGHTVATSNTHFDVLDEVSNKPIRADLITKDDRARDLARMVYRRFGSHWPSVVPFHSRGVSAGSWSDILFSIQDDSDFVIVFSYANPYGIDWIGIISVPYDSVMADIQNTQLSLGLATVAIAGALRIFGQVLDIGVSMLLQKVGLGLAVDEGNKLI